MNEIVQLISTVGFPICACLGLGYYIKYQNDQHYKERKEDSEKMTEAISNNTIALTKLCDKIGEKGE